MTGSRTTHAVPLDRHVLHEVGQMVRALEANGPSTDEELALLVGAAYWERNRFRAALAFARESGLIHRQPSSKLNVSS
ncbi:MAG: hypothetical protein ACLGH4_01805 [Actinomycetes bacterium]